MDPVQTQILLDKINTLWNNNSPLSAIERDLMLSYLRQLYAAVLDAPIAAPLAPQPQVRTAPSPSQTQIPVRPVITPAPTPVAAPSPVSIRPPIPNPSQAPAPAAPLATAPATPTVKTPESGTVDVLFTARSGADLSDRLSRQPIADLTRAFSINDRLLYTNDLFHKDQQAFAESVRQLDTFNELAMAKSMIAELAKRYDWLHEERLETAQTFVQLVSRRYINS